MQLLVAEIDKLPHVQGGGQGRDQKAYRTCAQDDVNKTTLFHENGNDERPIIHDPI